MKKILKDVIVTLIILGLIKTFQGHDILNEESYYYNHAKTGQLVQDITNFDFNNLKNIDLEKLNPSDFFKSFLTFFYNPKLMQQSIQIFKVSY
ncbi:hypothetical protein [Staphylococcus saccharolyticus]|uniref:hypothetical protein n=1 Tax=Staphylococcus saccharolyticus TaxID=33028 RepID=UPI003D7F19B0